MKPTLRFMSRIVIISLILIVCSSVSATITGRLSQNIINVNEYAELVLNLENTREENLNFPMHTQNYDVIAKQSSSNISIINNKFTQSKQLAYTLRFKKPGLHTLTIKDANNNPLQIQVNLNSSTTPNPISTAESSSSTQIRNSSKSPFALISVSKNSPYLNEQILFKLKIYHRGDLRQIQVPDFDFNDFIHKRSEKSKEYTENFQGENYFVYELAYTLYPIKSGSLTIPSRGILVSVLKENDMDFDPFDPFASFHKAFSVEEQISLKTNSLSINVKALPISAPKGFNGYVGNLKLNHRRNSDSAINGEPYTIFTTLSGNGNSNNLNLKNLFQESSEYSIYQDKPRKQLFNNNNQESFQINLSNALIPNSKEDTLLIKSNPIVIFNPETNRYETLNEEEIKLNLSHEKNSSKTEGQELNSNSITEEPDRKDLSKQTKKNELPKVNLPPLYLYLFISLLLIILFGMKIFSKIKALIQKRRKEQFPFKEYERLIEKSTNVSEISNKIKHLYNLIDNEQNAENKLAVLNPSLYAEFVRLIENTDKINYGTVAEHANSRLRVRENLEGNEIVSNDIKERALRILRELRKIYL